VPPRKFAPSCNNNSMANIKQMACCWLQYRTERNGLIETHIEKRTRVASVAEEDIDHDKVVAVLTTA